MVHPVPGVFEKKVQRQPLFHLPASLGFASCQSRSAEMKPQRHHLFHFRWQGHIDGWTGVRDCGDQEPEPYDFTDP